LGRGFGARRAPSAVRAKLNVILLENIAFALDLYGISLMKNKPQSGSITRRNIAATTESVMSEDDVAGVGDYEGAAAGWGALKAVADAVRGQKAIVKETRGLLSMNQPHGFDCPGCAWPDPKHTASFEFCENGAKAVAWEATAKKPPRLGTTAPPIKFDAVSLCGRRNSAMST
jgi:hypothetical protein